MVYRSGMSYLTSHRRLGLRKGCKFFPSQKQRHRRQPRPRPEWDNTIHDLSVFKLSTAQLEAKTNLFRYKHPHRSSSCLEKTRCFSVFEEQPGSSNALAKSEDAKMIPVTKNGIDCAVPQSMLPVSKENIEMKEVVVKLEEHQHQTKEYGKAFNLTNNHANTKETKSYNTNRCKSLPFIPRLKVQRIQALQPSECYQDETKAVSHPKCEHLPDHGLSATSTPTVDFENEVLCFEVCKGIIPCNEGSQCNLAGAENQGGLNTSVPAPNRIDRHGNISKEDFQHAKTSTNAKRGSPNCMRKSQNGNFPKSLPDKHEQLLRRNNRDILKCKPWVRKLQEQEPHTKSKEQRPGLDNLTCPKSKSYVATNTRENQEDIKCKESKISKRYFSSVKRTIPTGECEVNEEESHDPCALCKIELQYLRQEIRMYLKGQHDLLKELKDFKYVMTCKLENIQFEIQRLSKSQLDLVDSPQEFMDTRKENPISLLQPHKDTEPSCEAALVTQVEEIQCADPPKPREIPEFLKWRNLNPQKMFTKQRQSVIGGTPKAISTDAMHSLHKVCSDSATELFDSQLSSSISSKEIPGQSPENEINHPKDVLGSRLTHRGKTSEESSIMSSFSSWFSGSCIEPYNVREGRSDAHLRDINTTTSKLESTKTKNPGYRDVNRESDVCESSRTTSQDNDTARESYYLHSNTARESDYLHNDTAGESLHNDAMFPRDFSKLDNAVSRAKKFEVVSSSEKSLNNFDRDDATDMLGMSSDSSLHYWEENKNFTETRSSLEESKKSLVQPSISSLGMLPDGRSKANFLANEPRKEKYSMLEGETEQLQNLSDNNGFKTENTGEKNMKEVNSSRLFQALHSVNTGRGMGKCQTK